MIGSLLVANRGEIARRIIRTARRLGVHTVAVHSDVDAGLPFVAEADEAVPIGAPQAYRNVEAILAAAKTTGAQAIHPGYGFLSENADFARAVAAQGLVWVGPDASAIDAMGDKINARNLMAAAGVPVAPGTTDPAASVEAALAEAGRIGYPVMVKAAAGGGGMGMAAVPDPAGLPAEFEKVRGFAERMFGDGSVLIERYFPRVRHIEVQILGLADGRVVALGERECSVQRRNQKVLEESPSPAVSPQLRERLCAAAVRAGEAVGYRNAGTVECLLDPARWSTRSPRRCTGWTWSPSSFGWRPASRPASIRPRSPRAGTRSRCGSTPRTRSGSCPARVRSPPGSSRPVRESASTPGTAPVPR